MSRDSSRKPRSSGTPERASAPISSDSAVSCSSVTGRALSVAGTVDMKEQTPNHNYQITNKRQTQNLNDPNCRIGVSIIDGFGIGICLRFDAWCLVLSRLG